MIHNAGYNFDPSETNENVTEAILARLQCGPATTSDLIPYHHRFSIHIAELRKLGYEISTRKIPGTRICEFTLVGKRDVVIVSDEIKRAYYETDHWRLLRLKRLEIDGWQCTQCKCKNDLQVHHWKYELFNECVEHDLTTLCRICHEIMHQFDSVRIAFPPSISPAIAERIKPFVKGIQHEVVELEGEGSSFLKADAAASPSDFGCSQGSDDDLVGKEVQGLLFGDYKH